MKKIYYLFCRQVVLISLLLLGVNPVLTAAAQPPSLAGPGGLSIIEIKMTGDEFVLLQNNATTVIPDLSNYWLYNFNNTSPLSAGANSSQQQLPAAPLSPGGTLLLSSATRNTCGAELAGKLSISLTDSGGFLEIVQLSQDQAGTVQQKTGDAVSWSSGTNSSIQNVPSSTKAPQAVWYRYKATSNYAWQQAELSATNICELAVTIGNSKQPVSSNGLLQASDQPPATIISIPAGTINGDGIAAASIPISDIGLAVPQISELLPNPDGTDNDDTDEFIELYNSNDRSFDLSGFVLQTGITTKHSYTFPAQTLLPAKAFIAFYSEQTGLHMSNSSGQVTVLDPLGTVISQSSKYGTAKDGQAWALANGSWYWTSQLTPAAANVIKVPVTSTSSKASSRKKTATASQPKTKAAAASESKTKAKTAKSKPLSAAKTTANDTKPIAALSPVHPWTLAVIAGLAVAYALYEYRFDLANRLRQLKRHRPPSPRVRPPAARR